MRPSLALQTHRDAIRAIALIHRVTHVRVDFGQTQHEQRVRQPSSGVSLKNRMETDGNGYFSDHLCHEPIPVRGVPANVTKPRMSHAGYLQKLRSSVRQVAARDPGTLCLTPCGLW